MVLRRKSRISQVIRLFWHLRDFHMFLPCQAEPMQEGTGREADQCEAGQRGAREEHHRHAILCRRKG